MLIRELNLKNFILIDDLSLSFTEGLNVFTGETGAGKSIILEGLRICLGNKTSKDYLRDPEKKAIFELIIETEDDLYTVSREIFPSGKALSRLGGELTSVKEISEKIAPLLDIYGQKDQFSILDPHYQLNLLDQYGHESINPYLDQIKVLKADYEKILDEEKLYHELLNLDAIEIQRRFDELDAISIDPEEDEAFEQSFKRLEHAKDLSRHMNHAITLTEEEILHGLFKVEEELERIEAYDSSYEEYLKRCHSLRIDLEDLVESIKQDERALDIDEETLHDMNKRIEALFDVKKRYRKDLYELKAYQEELGETLFKLQEASEEIEKIELKKEAILKDYHEISLTLKEARSKAFKALKKEILEVFEGLELKGVNLDFEQSLRKSETIHEKGSFQGEMLASLTHQRPKPFGDVLSGGETSRFILGFKQVLSGIDQTKIMVFDEIDTGISGKVAFEVGKRIKELSKEKQIIAITHLPQLASFADKHFLIEKSGNKTTVTALNEKSIEERLALMMSSTLSDTALMHARELMEKARKEI